MAIKVRSSDIFDWVVKREKNNRAVFEMLLC